MVAEPGEHLAVINHRLQADGAVIEEALAFHFGEFEMEEKTETLRVREDDFPLVEFREVVAVVGVVAR